MQFNIISMKKHLFFLFAVAISFGASAQSLPILHTHTYETGIFNAAGTKVIAYDINSQRLFSVNKDQLELDIIDYSNPNKAYILKSVDLSPFIGNVNGVAVDKSTVAVVGEGVSSQMPGKLLFFDEDGNYVNQFTTGAKPDMVTFTPLGDKVLVANEGSPSDNYQSDPEGSVSILFNIGFGVGSLNQGDVQTVNFRKLDTTAYDPLINIYGIDSVQQVPSQNLEPEYISVSPDGTQAFVSLQENNAIAVISLTNNSANLDTVVGLGYKNHNLVGLDASDQATAINIRTFKNLYGMYQPDGLSSFTAGGQTYVASANEGAARDYSGYSEVRRVNQLALDPGNFPNPLPLINDTVLGRLKVSTSLGDPNGDGLYDSLFAFGGRSWSVWDAQGQLVWDSGDEIEQMLATLYPQNFNSDYANNTSYKSRSDDKGPEPECIVTGDVDGTTYAFVGLERMSGFMIYDLSNPASPQFVSYELHRDFSSPASDDQKNDLGPEHMVFIPANRTQTGFAYLFVANEVSGTINLFQMGQGVSLEEGYKVPDPSFYPNPSTGLFSTDVQGSYHVYDSSGRLVKTVEDQFNIDLSGEDSGFYVIRNEEGVAIRVIKR